MADKENLHSGHRKRMRERFLKNGGDAFSEHELLELFLQYAIPRVDTNITAHRLIKKFGSMERVFKASVDQLTHVDGIGESAAVLIKLIPDMMKLVKKQEVTGKSMDNFEVSCDFFSEQYLGENTEKVKIALIDDNLHLIECVDISDGMPGSVTINGIRKIGEVVYRNNCDKIILAHNHPNGVCEPSETDIKSTDKIYRELKVLGIDLLDHIIVAGNKAVSMKELGIFATI